MNCENLESGRSAGQNVQHLEAVGYCKPPKERQFRKGISGNPKGRPKKKETVSDAFNKAFSHLVEVKTKNGTRKITALEAIFLQREVTGERIRDKIAASKRKSRESRARSGSARTAMSPGTIPSIAERSI